MSPAPSDARKEDYWDRVEDSQTSRADLIREHAEASGWTVHAIIRAGATETITFGIVVASQARDAGMMLREGYIVVDDEDETVNWGEVQDRRVNGPLAQALLRGYARADNDRLGADDVDDPVVLDAMSEVVEDDPASLTEPIGEHPDAEHYADEDRTVADPDVDGSETVTCEATGKTIPKRDAVNIGAALGVEKWVAKSVAGDDDE